MFNTFVLSALCYVNDFVILGSVELDEDDAGNWHWVVGDDSKQQCKSVKLHQAELLEEERKLLEALELQRCKEEETKQKHLDEQERKKQMLEQIIQPLEDATGCLSTASSTVDVVSPRILPTSSLQLLSVQNGCQGPEVADSLSGQAILPSEHTNNTLRSHALPARNEHSMPHQISVNFPRADSTQGISEQQLVKDACNKVLEKVGLVEGMPPAGTDVLLAEDGDHLNSVQKKTKGGGNRNWRRRGPRIYAEEGIMADQDAESCKTSDFANGPRTLIQQNASKNNGRSSTIDQPKPLLRQNASRRFGVPPANGVHAVQPLLLLPAPPSFEGWLLQTS